MVFLKVLLVLDLQPLDDGRMVDEVEVSIIVVDVDDALDERHSTLEIGVVGHSDGFQILDVNVSKRFCLVRIS